ncbi:hypothetical protein [Saccharopolyspora sp. NPDC002376]
MPDREADRGVQRIERPTSGDERERAQHHARRDISLVPVTGLPPSTLALTYPRAAETSQLRAFAATLAEA